MPNYPFELEDGTYATEFFATAKRPPLGRLVTLEGGVKGRRVIAQPGCSVNAVVKGTRQIAPRSVPLNWPFAPRHIKPSEARPSEGLHAGQAVFHSQREIDNAVAAANDAGENILYDPD